MSVEPLKFKNEAVIDNLFLTILGYGAAAHRFIFMPQFGSIGLVRYLC